VNDTSPSTLRRFFGSLRHLPDRVFHPLRRRRARRIIKSIDPNPTILVLCLGNICRSPYAAARLEQMAARVHGPMSISSAGFIGPGRPSPKFALAAAEDRDIDLTGHQSRIVASEDVAAADLILVMERQQRNRLRSLGFPEADSIVVLGDLDPNPIATRTIRDPWGRDASVCAESYERIDNCITSLFQTLPAP
jgi:protein-tyrosine-phosphatase